MHLRYISVGLDRDVYGNDFGYDFKLNTRFISNYLSKAIRRAKFETDGTFNMISVRVSDKQDVTKLVAIDVLAVSVFFDKERYELIKNTDNCGYYLELFEEGFKKASEFKQVPLITLLNLIEEFRNGGCKNEWLHKKKKFKEQDIEVALRCEFTTRHFQLVVIISQISSKKELVQGVVLKTEPDEVLFQGMFKDVLVNDNDIIITDSSDSNRIIINKQYALGGKLNFKIRGDMQMVKMLTYQLTYP